MKIISLDRLVPFFSPCNWSRPNNQKGLDCFLVAGWGMGHGGQLQLELIYSGKEQALGK